MKTMTPQPTPAPETALASFDAELSRIDVEQTRLTEQFARIANELEALNTREQQRAQAEASAQAHIDAARNAHDEAQVRAELLTKGETAKAAQAQLATLEKQLRGAQEKQMRLLNHTQQEADADQRKRLRLEEDRNRAHITLAHLAERKSIAEHLRDKARFEQAEAVLQTHLDRLSAMQAQRDTQQAILHTMESEIEGYCQHALNELATYPEQQHTFQTTLPYSDRLTRILEAQLRLIDLVLSEGTGVVLPLEVKKRMNMTFLDLPQLLSVDHPKWWPALAARGAEPDLLLEQKSQIERILAIHRELQTNRAGGRKR